ncbi:MAG: Sir2 silent information regulator family NAD-dependent deacetylase [Corynebacterium sp.]|nr:Sir2 silent information regulator family NAD-dependent deacetylase [Corynebacterium sp.]
MKNSSAHTDPHIAAAKAAIDNADTILIGAGSGLSTAAGLTYSGPRFEKHFSDFIEKYGISDMYSGGFYPFESLEEYWAWWSRHIMVNRYVDPPKPVYSDLLSLVQDKNYFVITTNVDHQFPRAGFDKNRLFYTQGDYGLWQCSTPCVQETWDNEETVRRMYEEQRDMRVPTELIPRCPHCGSHMVPNLRCDETFVQDAGWEAACLRYKEFLIANAKSTIVYLELGVGNNTPGIIKYPFWQMTMGNPNSTYISINQADIMAPKEIAERSIGVATDIGEALSQLQERV